MTDAVVIVDNLPCGVTIKEQLQEYLGFAGAIKTLTVHKNEGKDTAHAVVTFEDAGATRTAVLMNNTPLLGGTITVTHAPKDYSVPKEDTLVLGSSGAVSVEASGSAAADPAGEAPLANSPEAVFQEVLKQGKAFADQAIDQLRAIDEQHHITATLTAVTEQTVQQAQAKMTELDSVYDIKGKALGFSREIQTQFDHLDQQYKITEATQQAKVATETAIVGLAAEANQTIDKISKDPAVAQGITAIESWGQATGKTIQEAIAAATTKQ